LKNFSNLFVEADVDMNLSIIKFKQTTDTYKPSSTFLN
jgi:hypothetical protein